MVVDQTGKVLLWFFWKQQLRMKLLKAFLIEFYLFVLNLVCKFSFDERRETQSSPGCCSGQEAPLWGAGRSACQSLLSAVQRLLLNRRPASSKPPENTAGHTARERQQWSLQAQNYEQQQSVLLTAQPTITSWFAATEALYRDYWQSTISTFNITR